jgi:hypothetical protein
MDRWLFSDILSAGVIIVGWNETMITFSEHKGTDEVAVIAYIKVLHWQNDLYHY